MELNDRFQPAELSMRGGAGYRVGLAAFLHMEAVYLLLQKYIVSGLTIGSVKG